jgi:hypothetical protein
MKEMDKEINKQDFDRQLQLFSDQSDSLPHGEHDLSEEQYDEMF